MARPIFFTMALVALVCVHAQAVSFGQQQSAALLEPVKGGLPNLQGQQYNYEPSKSFGQPLVESAKGHFESAPVQAPAQVQTPATFEQAPLKPFVQQQQPAFYEPAKGHYEQAYQAPAQVQQAASFEQAPARPFVQQASLPEPAKGFYEPAPVFQAGYEPVKGHYENSPVYAPQQAAYEPVKGHYEAAQVQQNNFEQVPARPFVQQAQSTYRAEAPVKGALPTYEAPSKGTYGLPTGTTYGPQYRSWRSSTNKARF